MPQPKIGSGCGPVRRAKLSAAALARSRGRLIDMAHLALVTPASGMLPQTAFSATSGWLDNLEVDVGVARMDDAGVSRPGKTSGRPARQIG